MVLRRINNLVIIFIILCSAGFYGFTFLGPLNKIAELLGIVLILFLFILHITYGKQDTIPKNFILPIVLIILSIITSMFMAKFSRNQDLSSTLYAQRGMYYYCFYFLLHQLKIKPRDLEIIFVAFSIIYVAIYLLQYSLYPKIIINAYVRYARGTVRIYMAGSAFLAVAYLMSIQYFFRTNNFKYLALIIIYYIILILTGGRQTLAIMTLVLILFLILDHRVRSRIFMFFLAVIGCIMIYLLFQTIIDSLIFRVQADVSKGEDYVRIRATEYFLTDFFKNTLSYITGNGMYGNETGYGNEINRLMSQFGYFLGDIGIIGNYVIYGFFFVLGVLLIFLRVTTIKIQTNFIYIKYMFLVTFLSILTGGGFAQGNFICFIMCILYLIDASNYEWNRVQIDKK